jgi:uncharacterized protein YndB with AHSA1/START domain
MNDRGTELVDRTVIIRARPSTVFRFFTDSPRFAAWWGAGSRIEGRPGGEVHIHYPNGVTAGGTVLEIESGRRIVFTYGYDAPDKPFARGATRVTVTVEDHPEGTLLRLVHELPDRATRDAHDPGWRFQLSLFANAVSREQAPALPALVDRYFAAWAETDSAARDVILAAVTRTDVVVRDGFAALASREDLHAHIAATHIFLPGSTLERQGEPRLVQGTALVDWIARGPDGTPRGRGTNVVELDADGRIAKVIGFTAASPS